MMITIHGLAPKTKYLDLKILIKQECNIDDFILDNLIAESDGTKKVRVGLLDENAGYKLMKCLNGYRMPGNFILKVEPVGKPNVTVTPNIPPQSNYDSRPSYQPRNDYSNQPRNEYMGSSNSNDYNRGPHPSSQPGGPITQHGSSGPHGSSAPHGSSGPHGPSGPHGSSGPHGGSKSYGPGGPHGSIDNLRPSPWLSNNNNSSQWTPNPPLAAQVPQNNFNYASGGPNVPPAYGQQHPNIAPSRPETRTYDQGRHVPPSETSYGGYPPKSGNAPPSRQPDPRHNLRNVDFMESGNVGATPIHSGRYPPNHYQQDKPVTIMKDNFQGPTQYNINHPAEPLPYQQSSSAPWQQGPGHQALQSKAQFSKSSPLAYEKNFEDRKYLHSDQARDPKTLQTRPDTYKEYEKRRGFSPSARDPIPRRSSPPGRREDAINRDVSRPDMSHRRGSPPGRMEPTQRRPSPHELRYSPSRKRVSPVNERRPAGHPSMRLDSPPHKRPSPSRRLVSPTRRDDRPLPRFSPGRHHSDKMPYKYDDSKDVKKVRPAYEPTQSHAQNQAIYSGGYRQGSHDNTQYQASSGMRQEKSESWQRHREEHNPSMKIQEDLRKEREARLQRIRIRERLPEQTEKRFSPTRKSRSPTRRDRSPLRDRYKRNSPSPRSSYSPRRSWALEKRRSPDAPPPPVWPGQNEHTRSNRPNFTEKEEKSKYQPIWEPRSFKEEEPRRRHPDEQKAFEDAKIRLRTDLMPKEPASQPNRTDLKDRYQRETKFSPRDDFEERRDFRRRESPERKYRRDEFDIPKGRDDDRDDYNRRKDSPRHERKLEPPRTKIDREFEDIYNRTMQFKKKAEELRKSGSKKRDDFDEDRRHVEKDRDDMRQHIEERSRYREEELHRQREREERREDRPRDDRGRDNRMRDDRVRHDDDRRGDYRPRDIQSNKIDQDIDTNNAMKQKRNKAIDEIAEKIIQRNEDCRNVQGEQRQRILEELKIAVSKIVYDMFGDADISFIEIIIKYQAKYDLNDEAKILQDVMRSLPKPFRIIKRHAPEAPDIPAKTSRFSPIGDKKQEPTARPKLSDSNFNVNLAPPSVISMPCIGVPQGPTIMNQSMVPTMVSTPFYQSLQQGLPNSAYVPKPVPPVLDFMPTVQPVVDFNQQPMMDFQTSVPDFNPQLFEEDSQEGFRLYLCKDDFGRMTHGEADMLKDYLISQMFKATANYQGWSPDFTLKGLQSLYRYELVTKDVASRNWLFNLDFSEFEDFHVLVYTKEELWYERAAIWLPGHSRVRNIEPLDKLKLQNKKVPGVNIDQWKFIKKIVTEKGTRLYVDMPPSSARALEAHGMELSYELQQVSVFPKAVAVDKNSFDAGMREHSISPQEVTEAIKNLPMPSLPNDPGLVKIILKGSKTLSLVDARKIKEVVIYNLYQYHQQDGISRTDFIKYGLVQPNYFAIAPLNQESKKWLLGCSFGKVNRQAVMVIGGEEDNTRFFKMYATVQQDTSGFGPLRTGLIMERLKTSNQGVKGINFNLWKPINIKGYVKGRVRFEVEMDMESLETLATMQYQLDYVDSSGSHTLYFRSEYSQYGLENMIKKYKAEMTDSYDVANMDLESDQSDTNDDSVICLD